MRRTRLVLATIALSALATATPAAARAGTTANVYRFADGSQVPEAWSSLTTTDASAGAGAGAEMTLHTSDLPAGHTVTVWWVIFNQPQNCSHPEAGLRCGPGDLPIFGGDDTAVTSIVYAAGHEVGASGRATFAGHLGTGDTTGALFGPGLTNPTGADIHLVVRDHGALPPDQRADGIHHFGPCDPACTNLQFSPHEQ